MKIKRMSAFSSLTDACHDDISIGYIHEWKNSFSDIFWHSSLYLVFFTIPELIVTMEALLIEWNLSSVIFPLMIFAVYNEDRLIDLENDPPSPRKTFIKEHYNVLYATVSICYFTSGVIALNENWSAFCIIITGYSIEQLYTKKFFKKRIKDIFLLNSFAVAFDWCLLLVILPLIFEHKSFDQTSCVLFIYFLSTSFISVENLNIPDIESDRQQGVSTLSTVFGITITKTILILLDCGILVLLFTGMNLHILQFKLAISLIVGTFFSIFITTKIGSSKYFEKLVDFRTCVSLLTYMGISITIKGIV
jgi:4-hydroxybenzoate polyprenyltransferase